MGLFFKKAADKVVEKKEGIQVSEVLTVETKDAVLGLPVSLVQPRISEKASRLIRLNKYVFVVKNKANKVEVKKAVEKKHKVKVVSVNIVNNKGKMKNFGRISGKRSDFKKAVVTLKKGDSIKGLTEVA